MRYIKRALDLYGNLESYYVSMHTMYLRTGCTLYRFMLLKRIIDVIKLSLVKLIVLQLNFVDRWFWRLFIW